MAARAIARCRWLLPVVIAVLLTVFVNASSGSEFTFKSTAVNGGGETINGQKSPGRHLAGRVGEFEGQLNYYLPKTCRTHPERVSLATRPLDFPLSTAGLPGVLLDFYEKPSFYNPLLRSIACWNPHLVDEPETEIIPPVNCPLKQDSAGYDKSTHIVPFDESCSHRGDFNRRKAATLQMMRLEDVFDHGFALNRTHLFLATYDANHMPATYDTGHMVHELPAVFSWAHRPASNFFHFLVELVPLFLVAAPLMPSTLRHLPVLVRRHQSIPLPSGARVAGPSLWQMMRRRHLLHPSGIPLFNLDWTYHSHRPLSLAEARSFPSDWVVVLAKRLKGKKRAVVNFEEVEEEVVRPFGSKRVVLHTGSMPILEGGFY
ncbi:unnamed protein product [Closterium sp. NIES-64]|nr:unnamed protein product [Closterium sp. NIES-64]